MGLGYRAARGFARGGKRYFQTVGKMYAPAKNTYRSSKPAQPAQPSYARTRREVENVYLRFANEYNMTIGSFVAYMEVASDIEERNRITYYKLDKIAPAAEMRAHREYWAAWAAEQQERQQLARLEQRAQEHEQQARREQQRQQANRAYVPVTRAEEFSYRAGEKLGGMVANFLRF